MRKWLCKMGFHRYARGVTGFVDRCVYCNKPRVTSNYTEYTGY